MVVEWQLRHAGEDTSKHIAKCRFYLWFMIALAMILRN